MNRYIVGLTGGIGSGKTAVSNVFEELGVDIIDADVCARLVVEPGTQVLDAIRAKFGQSILQTDGQLDRTKLRQHVFSNPDDKAWLNHLLHPLIREEMLRQIQSSISTYCILVAPLLIENNMQGMVDRILVVDASEQNQLHRALARDGSSRETIEAIMNAQCSRQERLTSADDVIDNNQSLEAMTQSVQRLHQQYLTLASKSSNT